MEDRYPTTLELHTDRASVGGGPAGLVLALALLRHGIRVTVLEKHADFLRDFRGGAIHPYTQDLLAEFGRVPHPAA